MNTEDDKIRELFESYNPRLTSDEKFMEDFARNIDRVELIRRHLSSNKTHNRLAVIVAAIAGFIIGVGFTLIMPLVVPVLATVSFLAHLQVYVTTIWWIVVALITALVAYGSYTATLSALKSAGVRKVLV